MSTRFALSLAAALAVIPLAGTARAGEGAEPDYAKLMLAKAPTVVTVKSVLKLTWQGGEREQNDERVGAVVDASGVVMMQNWASSPNFKATPISIRVLFEGDEKLYDAVLGAMDSTIGLAFIRIKDLAGKMISAVDMNDSVEMKIGDEVFGVIRTDEGFDYAPYFGTGRLVGQVQKPRPMWLLVGFSPLGHPLYNPEGKFSGVAIRQTGISEEGGGSRNFLLPAKAVSLIVARAIKASAKALEDAKAHEAEALKGDGAAMGDVPGMDSPAPGMGNEPAPGMGEAPAGMEAGK